MPPSKPHQLLPYICPLSLLQIILESTSMVISILFLLVFWSCSHKLINSLLVFLNLLIYGCFSFSSEQTHPCQWIQLSMNQFSIRVPGGIIGIYCSELLMRICRLKIHITKGNHCLIQTIEYKLWMYWIADK